MNLDQAIKKIINDHGTDILKDRRFVNMLSDLQAFGQLPYAANMLRQIYQKGYGEQISHAYAARDVMQINAVKKNILDRFGYDSNNITKIFNDFNLAFGLKPMEKEVRGTIFHYDKIKIVNTRIINCDVNGREIKKSTFSTKEIRYLTPKVNIVSGYDSDRTIDFTIKVTNKGKTHSYSWQVNIKSGQSEDLLLQGYGNDSGFFFSPGECSFEIYLDDKILAQKGINISKPKMTEEEKDKRDTTIKIVAVAIAVLLNIPIYFVSGWWLFLTIFATGWTFCCSLKQVTLEWRKWMIYACLISVFITILTPLPWWLLIIEMIGVCATDTPFDKQKNIF